MKAATAKPTDLLSSKQPDAPSCHAGIGWADRWANVSAVAGVVLLELKRRKDFYALFFITAVVTLLLGSVSYFNADNIVRYVKEISLFLIWASSLVIAVTTAARQIPQEREHRTIFPLLAKPVTRDQVLLGKFMGCWWASGLCLALFYLFFGLVTGWQEHTWPVASYLQAVLLHWFVLAVVIALTLLGSLIFAAPSSTNTICLVTVAGLLLLARHLNKVAIQLEEPGQSLLYAIYFVVPHLEFFDVRDLIVHNWGTIAWGPFFLALLYAAFYSAVFLTFACWRFRRRPVNQ